MFDSPCALTLRSALTFSVVSPWPSRAAVFAAMSPSSTSFRFVFCWACWLLLLTGWQSGDLLACWLLLKTSEAVAVYFLVWCLEKP